MDCLGYAASKNFIVVAVTTNLSLTVNNEPFTHGLVKKVHRYNDRVMYAAVGDPFKVTGIAEFFEHLSQQEQGPIETYDQVRDHFSSTFNVSPNADLEQIRRTGTQIEARTDENDNLAIQSLLASLPEGSDQKALVTDALRMLQMGIQSPTYVFLFGVDSNPLTLRASKRAIIGHHLASAEVLPQEPGNLVMEFFSSTRSTGQNNDLSARLCAELLPHMPVGWEDSAELTDRLLIEVNVRLIKGLTEMAGYPPMPTIVTYEASTKTGFLFSEPGYPLTTVALKQPISNDPANS